MNLLPVGRSLICPPIDEVKATNKAVASAGLNVKRTVALPVDISPVAAVSANLSSMTISPVSPPARKGRDILSELPTNGAAPTEDLTYEEALKRKAEKELEQAKLLCSLENKEVSNLQRQHWT